MHAHTLEKATVEDEDCPSTFRTARWKLGALVIGESVKTSPSARNFFGLGKGYAADPAVVA